MEHEIRQNIPILYYNIWDDIPDPLYNSNFYRSSDMLMSISKQTYGINKRILSKHGYEDWQTDYVPHGITDKRIFKIEDNIVSIFKIRPTSYPIIIPPIAGESIKSISLN